MKTISEGNILCKEKELIFGSENSKFQEKNLDGQQERFALEVNI